MKLEQQENNIFFWKFFFSSINNIKKGGKSNIKYPANAFGEPKILKALVDIDVSRSLSIHVLGIDTLNIN